MQVEAQDRGTVPVMGVEYSRLDLAGAVRQLVEWVESPPPTTRVVLATGFHGLWTAQRNEGYRRILNSADMLCADGMAPVLLSRAVGDPLPERVPGPDLMQAYIEHADRSGMSSYFLGDTERTLQMLRSSVEDDYPGHRVVGAFSPPFSEVSREEELEAVEKVNESAPDVLWVALGTPKQERWVDRNRDALEVPVVAAVGAAFRFLSERTPRAPKWVGKMGLEWTWRLAMEPRKMWRRSLVQGPRFALESLRWIASRDREEEAHGSSDRREE